MKGYPSAPAHQCDDCRYFILHYYKFTEHTYHPLHYSHCTFPLCKNRRVEETCPHWTAKEEACAKKQHLCPGTGAVQTSDLVPPDSANLVVPAEFQVLEAPGGVRIQLELIGGLGRSGRI